MVGGGGGGGVERHFSVQLWAKLKFWPKPKLNKSWILSRSRPGFFKKLDATPWPQDNLARYMQNPVFQVEFSTISFLTLPLRGYVP